MSESWSHIAEDPASIRTTSSTHASGQERRNRAWARLTASAARGDASAWRHLVTVHTTPLWHFALDCGLTADQAEQACELAWLRAAQSLEERPHLGQSFGHELRAAIVDEAHRSRADRAHADVRPRLDLVAAPTDATGDESGSDGSEPPTPGEGEQRMGIERRRRPRRGADEPSPPYFEAFDRIATALEGIEQALADRAGAIVMPDAGPLERSHPRP